MDAVSSRPDASGAGRGRQGKGAKGGKARGKGSKGAKGGKRKGGKARSSGSPAPYAAPLTAGDEWGRAAPLSPRHVTYGGSTEIDPRYAEEEFEPEVEIVEPRTSRRRERARPAWREESAHDRPRRAAALRPRRETESAHEDDLGSEEQY